MRCIADSSSVDFGNPGGPTFFNSCDIKLTSHAKEGPQFFQETLAATEQKILPGGILTYVYVGGTITVPSDAVSGEKIGVIRIEVTYL